MSFRLTEEQLAALRKKQALREQEYAVTRRLQQIKFDAANKLAAETAKLPKPSKYKAVKTDGYSSKKEAKRAAELKLLEQAGKIRNLREQVKFEVIPKTGTERACHYIADFTYMEVPNGLTGLVVEDVKSPASRTAEYIIKRKLMNWRFNIQIKET